MHAPLDANTWFVSTGHVNAANYPPSHGSSASAPFRTISYAVHNAQPGDTIFVEAGVYDSDNDDAGEEGDQVDGYRDSEGIVIDKSDLLIIGYNATFNNIQKTSDLDDSSGVPEDYDEFDDQSSLVSMPTVIGESRSDNYGFDIVNATPGIGEIEIRNFRITNFKMGVKVDAPSAFPSADNRFENLLIYEIGSTTAKQGIGIRFVHTDDSLIKRCFIVNASYCGIRLKSSDYNDIHLTDVHADDGTTLEGACDYYFDIANSHHNHVFHCYAERHHPDAHYGHGFVVQANSSKLPPESSTYNAIEFCDSRNLGDAYYVRGAGVVNNNFSDCKSEGDPGFTSAHGKILVASGPKDNVFHRMRIMNGRFGLAFEYKVAHDEYAANASDGNTFINCIFENHYGNAQSNLAAAIDMRKADDPLGKEVINTEFIHCTFVGGENFCQHRRLGENNLFHGLHHPGF